MNGCVNVGTARVEARFVRPLGGSYGLEDGSSYENAWNGFANVGSIPVGGDLFIAGTHTEAFTAGQSNFNIRGDYQGDAGVVTGSDVRNGCIFLSSRTGIIIKNITLTDVLEYHIRSDNSQFVTIDIAVDGSADQGVHHTGNTFAYHYNLEGSNCLDEVISVHDDSIVYINGGNYHDNAAAINNVQNSTVYVNGDVTFLNNTTDIESNSTLEANNQILTGGVSSGTGGNSVFNNCNIGGLFEANAGTVLLVANNSIVDSARPQAGAELTLNQCIFQSSNVFGTLRVNKCRSPENTTGILVRSTGTLVARNCLFEKHSSGEKVKPQSGGIIDLLYCVLYSTSGSGEIIEMPSGGVLGNYSNNTIIAGSKTGFINATGVNAVLNNNIYTGCVRALSGSPNAITDNNGCFFDNDNANNGTVTLIDEVTTNPLLADVVNLDFSLEVGSSCIGTGKTLSEATGIDTADWGDGVTTTPVVSTKEQSASWDIGAYIS